MRTPPRWSISTATARRTPAKPPPASSPTDADSVFRLRLASVPAQPGQKNVIFSPRLTDRSYTDLDASGATKFYPVEISKP